jgi:hypothetical protein
MRKFFASARAADAAAWERIVEFCLQGDNSAVVDERTLEAVITALDNPERFNELLQAVQAASDNAASIGARAAALLGLIRKAMDRLKERDQLNEAAVLQTVADSTAHMTAEMMLSLLREAREHSESGEPPLAAAVVARIGDGAVASFVAGSIVAEHGATERLALAFETLVPDTDRKERTARSCQGDGCAVTAWQRGGLRKPLAGSIQPADVVLRQEFRFDRIRPGAVGCTNAGDRGRTGVR